ncbi:RNA-binding Ran Zn-finger protein [Phytophthora cinnamomi]|uniref:RNA-binding Ran Zn-finger protein n=1 Tax=Phytophthora cinnamomi TaxID=4785 RepID=UPI00355A1630|nr:RNA-binding Ran Zn-finger protein [Phytophthora cinnamomi]
MESSQRVTFEHKTVAGGKGIQVACVTCTFLNNADVSKCGMCGAEMKPPTHDVQADGSWKCGGCGTENRRAVKECSQCRLPFYSLVTTAAPAQIFCSRCGFLNDGGNLTCVQCDYTIRSTLDKISTDLRDSTNFLARDMGVNIHVKCPGCFVVCYVPPATACLRCGSCHTYFASPSVGEVTNFHMTRLASSISSSFMGFFGGKRGGQEESEDSRRQEEAREAPVGRLIAAGQGVVNSPRHSSTISEASELSTSLQQLEDSEVSGDESEEKPDASQVQDCTKVSKVQEKQPTEKQEEAETSTQQSVVGEDHSSSPAHPRKEEPFSSLTLSSSDSSGKEQEQPILARSMPLRTALPAPRQELVEVEGDIVEL